jgi:hypothetical protein
MPSLNTPRAAFQHSEESNHAAFDIPDALGKRQYLTVAKLLEAASGCKITAAKTEGRNEGLHLALSGDRRARRAAAIYIFYRICVGEDNKLRNLEGGGFLPELLNSEHAREIVVPDRYQLRQLREGFFKSGQVFSKSKEMGVLVDFTRLDVHRKIGLLSVHPGKRDAMVAWIRSVAEATLSAPPAPAPVPQLLSPLLSEKLAQRTVEALVEAGFDLGRSRRIVETLADKGDVQAAMNRCLDTSFAAVAATVPTAASEAHQSDASSLSEALTHLGPPSTNTLAAPPPSPPPRPVSSPVTGVGLGHVRAVGRERFPTAMWAPSPLQHPASPWPVGGAEPTDVTARNGRASSDFALPFDLDEQDLPRSDGAVDNSACAICLATEACHAFVPCGHVAACSRCAELVFREQGMCPMCRAPVSSHLRIWF